MATTPHSRGRGACLIEPASGRLVAIDGQIAAWLGVDPRDCGKHCLADLVPSMGQEPWATKWTSLIQGDVPSLSLESMVVGQDGYSFLANLSVDRLAGPNGDQLLVVIRPQDSTPEPAQHRDALTGLPDRRALTAHRERWQRQSAGQAVPHAVLFLDLDDFKQVNDRWGHAVGDRVLETLAPRWQKCVRQGDLVTRYGGDEFVVLLKNVRRPEEVEPIVARLLEATRAPIQVGQQQLAVSATIGVAMADDVSTDLAQLLAAADRAMYEVKKSGQ